MTEPFSDETGFAGHPGRECGEHRPTIYRAWCYECREWCYPDAPCARCELPQLRRQLDEVRAPIADRAVELTANLQAELARLGASAVACVEGFSEGVRHRIDPLR